MVVAYSLILIPEAYPAALESGLFLGLLILVYTVGPLGSFWMLYQVIRYEKRIARYVVIAFVPYMFIWYYLGRYRMRQGQDQLPVAHR